MEIKKALSEVVSLNPNWKICYKSKNWSWKVELCCLKIRAINKTVTWNIIFFSFNETSVRFVTNWSGIIKIWCFTWLGKSITNTHYLDKTTFKTTGYAYYLAFKITRKTLQCFKKLYPKVHTIIDCTEIFTETPSSLDSHCLLWSDYKHHTTIKISISVIPNGVIHFLGFPCVWWENFRCFLYC